MTEPGDAAQGTRADGVPSSRRRPSRRAVVFALAALLAVGAGAALLLPDRAAPIEWTTPPLIAPAPSSFDAIWSPFLGLETLPVLRPRHYASQSSSQLEHHAYRYSPSARLALRDSPVLFSNNRDMNNFLCRGREAKLHPEQLIPLELAEGACAEPYAQGLALARFSGPGVLTRVWLTLSSLLHGHASEVLRVYVDDAASPVVQAPVAAMLDGRAPAFASPFGAAARHAVAWYFPIPFEQKLLVTLDQVGPNQAVYHQTSASLGANAPPSPHSAQGRPPAERIRLEERGAEAGSVLASFDDALAPESRQTLRLQGPATVRAVVLRLRADAAEDLRDVGLRVRWDGDAAAAIDVPLLDLFAYWSGVPQSSVALATRTLGDRVELTLRLPMPFETSGELELINDGPVETSFGLELRGDPGLPAAPWGHLHVERHAGGPEPTGSARPLLQATAGPGRLVGVCVQLQGSAGPYFLERDVDGGVDGRRLRGTGTEDYFDAAFFFRDGPTATPFAQVWSTGGDDDTVAACRFHLYADAIDFQQRASLELEPGDASTRSTLASYRTVAYVYLAR